jgi:dolichol-phosphate mannosyltransferase
VPTRHEAGDLEELLHHISAVAGIPTEVVFIDDSDDATPSVDRTVARRARARRLPDFAHPPAGHPANWRPGWGRRRRPPRRPRTLGVCPRRGPSASPEVIPMLLAKAVRRGAEPGGGQPVLRAGMHRRARADPHADLDRLRVRGERAVPVAPSRHHRSDERVPPCSAGRGRYRRTPTPRFKLLLELLVRGPALGRAEVGFAFTDRHAGESRARCGKACATSGRSANCALVSEALSRPTAGVAAVEPLLPLLQEAATAWAGLQPEQGSPGRGKRHASTAQ